MNTRINTPIQHHLVYMAYLIRFWQDAPNGPWRASAQSVQTGEIVRFSSRQALYEFLENEVTSTNHQNLVQRKEIAPNVQTGRNP